MKNKQIDLKNYRLTPFKRSMYALGDAGYNFVYYWVNTYMVIYFTDVIGVEAGMISLLLLCVRIFDAINDPIIGGMADRTRSRWGRYRPWIIIGAFFVCILIVILFSASPDWAYNTRVIFMWVVYILLTIACTCNNMPYNAMNGCITADAEDRLKTSSLRMVAASTVGMVILVIAVPLILRFSDNGTVNSARGYFWAVLITAVIALVAMVLSGIVSKEVVTPPPNQKNLTWKGQIQALTKNKPMLMLIAGHFLLACVMFGRGSMLVYYWQYNSGDAGLASIYGIIGVFAAIIGNGWLCNFIYKFLPSKGKVAAILLFLSAITFVPLYFIDPTTIGTVNGSSIIFWFFIFINNTIFLAYTSIHFSAIGDAVDYGEYVTGIRADGFLSSFSTLAMKTGSAVMPAVAMAVLQGLHYVPNEVQSQEVLTAVNFMVSLLPAIICVINGILYYKFPIDAKKHDEILSELIKRRKEDY